MNWTSPAELKAQVQKRWDRGDLLSQDQAELFPLRLKLKGPSSKEMSERYAEVHDWIAQLSAKGANYRIEWRSVNHRTLGANQLPDKIWVDSLEDALAIIGKRRSAHLFAQLLEQSKQLPAISPWLKKRPLRAIELFEDWPKLLRVVSWLQKHPRPAIYLRQVDIPGIHSKFIESHYSVLSELLDLALPAEAIDEQYSGARVFCQRYGFLDKPSLLRFRLLDPQLQLLDVKGEQDISVSKEAFASLKPAVSRVFITENEINFLSFPAHAGAMVIFGAGYGFRALASADWLHDKEIYYWGDIDTHGFAILNQLRNSFPHAISVLMDEPTLLGHQDFWGREDKPQTAELALLNPKEQDLYDKLRNNVLGAGVRLEQEVIRFTYLENALRML